MEAAWAGVVLMTLLIFPYRYKHVCLLGCFSCVWLFATPWTIAHKAPLSMGFFREEYWSGLPCHPPGDLPNPEMEPESHVSCIGRWVLYHSCPYRYIHVYKSMQKGCEKLHQIMYSQHERVYKNTSLNISYKTVKWILVLSYITLQRKWEIFTSASHND